MNRIAGKAKTKDSLLEENLNLRMRLEEAEETLRAIREGEVDAIVVSGSRGDQVFSLSGAESVYRLIVDTMKEAALTVDFEGRILFCNNQFSELIHTSQEKILGKRLPDFVLPEEQDSMTSLIARTRRQAVRQRVVFRSARGDRIPVHVSSNIFHHADGASICIVATDLTELESSTERLRETIDRLNAEIPLRRSMEEQLRARSDQLSRMAAQLTIAEEQERRRITEILHDNLQQLLVGAKLQVAGLQRNPERVRESAGEIDRILGQSIDLTRSLTSELSPPVLRQSGFAPALEWLANRMKDRHGLEVELQADQELDLGNEDIGILLFQSVRELLFNVVKHACTPRARVSADRVQNQVRIRVSDDGVGCDPSQMQNQTNRFGLFSIRERLNSLGGYVQMDSAPGKGCRVTLLAPIPPTAATGGERPQVRVGPRPIRIVIADDHVTMRQGLALLLKAQPDMDVVGEASDGLSAIAMARQLLPDVMIMDIGMPVMNGLEATQIIHSEIPGVQVIGLSMFEEEEKAEVMKRAGAVRYLTKTGPSNILIAAIRETARSAPQRSVMHLIANNAWKQ